MELGFETIGNATTIVHDRGPVLVTDPWLDGTAYFGSWALQHEIPSEQRENALACEYVWFSHGHPDHLNPESLPLLRGKKILLPDHVGGRIRRELEGQGFSVTVLRDRRWYRLSDRVEIQSLADCNQDAIGLIRVGNALVIDTNDAQDFGRARHCRALAARHRLSFLLSISGWGDADMSNFYDENGTFVGTPTLTSREPIGERNARKAEKFGAKYFVPFSSFHRYHRTDSAWGNRYLAGLSDYATGFSSRSCEALPAFIRYNLAASRVEEIRPRELAFAPQAPENFGDRWSDPLEKEDQEPLEKYFRSFEHLTRFLDFVRIRCGGTEHLIQLGGGFDRGVTFEAPRASLMTSVKYSIFDDMLIGNFMKTTIHGAWTPAHLYPDFTPYVTKYGDNGNARTEAEVAAYFREYERRSMAFRLHRLRPKVMSFVMETLPKGSLPYRLARGIYRRLGKRCGLTL